MKKRLQPMFSLKQKKPRGAILIMVALLLVVFLGIAALVIDLSSQYVVRNELQNAADAGALGGARALYIDLKGEITVNPEASQEAYDAAIANIALAVGGATAVEVNWTAGDNNLGDVQIGHWDFDDRNFIPADGNYTEEPYDDDSGLSNNAVRVMTRREATPAPSFFARIFGHEDFVRAAEAVAYVGSFRPRVFDQPMAICRQSIIREDDGSITCSTGRMIDSGREVTRNTGAWTNFTQEPCDVATPSETSDLICAEGNPDPLSLFAGVGLTGGMLDTVYRELRDCWLDADPDHQDERGYPTKPWQVTLAVIDCQGNNPANCSEVVGAITLDVVWIKQSGADPHWEDIPLRMDHTLDGEDNSWECPEGLDGEECWQDFADHFNLQTYDGTPVGDLSHSEVQKTIFFLPNCEEGLPGPDEGVFEILVPPVLVK